MACNGYRYTLGHNLRSGEAAESPAQKARSRSPESFISEVGCPETLPRSRANSLRVAPTILPNMTDFASFRPQAALQDSVEINKSLFTLRKVRSGRGQAEVRLRSGHAKGREWRR